MPTNNPITPAPQPPVDSDNQMQPSPAYTSAYRAVAAARVRYCERCQNQRPLSDDGRRCDPCREVMDRRSRAVALKLLSNSIRNLIASTEVPA